ncbi:sulfotransferase [bacterium]|nr:sulfotransferase [bacterium]
MKDSSRKNNLVNLFIVGAPKCASTTIYNYLGSHPSVFMSHPKELNYFSKEEIQRQELYYHAPIVKDMKDYEKLFKRADEYKIVGEGSVSYFIYEDVPGKIAEYNQDARIIIVLRNPVARSYSHYLMDRRLGYVKNKSFDLIFRNPKRFPNYFQQYFSMSKYSIPVNRYIEAFGRHRVKVILEDDIAAHHVSWQRELCDFLDLDHFITDLPLVSNSFKEPKNYFFSFLYQSALVRDMVRFIVPQFFARSLKKFVFSYKEKPVLDFEITSALYSFFRDDVLKLEKTLQRDLSSWLGKDVQND